jgi:hypothetical protein
LTSEKDDRGEAVVYGHDDPVVFGCVLTDENEDVALVH